MCLQNYNFSMYCGSLLSKTITKCRTATITGTPCSNPKSMPDIEVSMYCRMIECAQCIAAKERIWAINCPVQPFPEDAKAEGWSESSSEGSSSPGSSSPLEDSASSRRVLTVRNVSVKKKFVPERKLTVRNNAPTEEELKRLEEEAAKADGIERRYLRRK